MQRITSKLLLRVAAGIMLLHTIGHIAGSAGWQNPNGQVPADVVQKMQNTHFAIQGLDTTMAMSFSGMNYIASVFLLLVTCTLWIFSNRTGKDASIILITAAAAITCVAVVEWLFFFPAVAFLSLAASVLTYVSVYKLNRNKMRKHIPYILSISILFCFFLLAEKAGAQANQNIGDTSTYVKGITAGRAKALTIVVLGLISLVLVLRAKKRFAKSYNNRNAVVVAFIVSLLTITLSVLHLLTSAGAVFGSGSGKAGAIVALLLGLIGTGLSGVALRKK